MRFLSWIFLILTIAAVVLDYRAQGDEPELVLRSLGQTWNDLHPSSLQQAEPALDRYVSPGLWLDYVLPVLEIPAAILFGCAFLLFYVLSGLFRRPRGYRNAEPV